MAKTKKITVSAFENAVKKNFKNIVEEEWCGLQLVITPTISLQEVFNIVADVSSNCFSDDGTYIPEALTAVLNCNIIEKYTNISLPKDISERYELVMRSDLMNIVFSHINEIQYGQIVEAIQNKVDYACDSNVSKLGHSISQIVESVKSLKERAEQLFDGMSTDEVRSAIDAIGGGRGIEDMAVSEYLKANS